MAFVNSVPEKEESVAAVMRRYPAQALPMMAFSDNILRSGECAFTAQERELIAAYVSGINLCTYCYGTHKATAEAFGVDEGLLQAMLDDLESAGVDDRLRPVLRYAAKLTRTPSRMVQADAEAIFAAGWDEDAFHFTVMICALFNMMNRIMDGYGVRNTAEFRLESGRRLAEQGYKPVAESIRKTSE
jgi:uncharacterized peroxidase-related enzyme